MISLPGRNFRGSPRRAEPALEHGRNGGCFPHEFAVSGSFPFFKRTLNMPWPGPDLNPDIETTNPIRHFSNASCRQSSQLHRQADSLRRLPPDQGRLQSVRYATGIARFRFHAFLYDFRPLARLDRRPHPPVTARIRRFGLLEPGHGNVGNRRQLPDPSFFPLSRGHRGSQFRRRLAGHFIGHL